MAHTEQCTPNQRIPKIRGHMDNWMHGGLMGHLHLSSLFNCHIYLYYSSNYPNHYFLFLFFSWLLTNHNSCREGRARRSILIGVVKLWFQVNPFMKHFEIFNLDTIPSTPPSPFIGALLLNLCWSIFLVSIHSGVEKLSHTVSYNQVIKIF